MVERHYKREEQGCLYEIMFRRAEWVTVTDDARAVVHCQIEVTCSAQWWRGSMKCGKQFRMYSLIICNVLRPVVAQGHKV